MRERLRAALHTGVKRALAVVSSHYAVNLEAIRNGYILPNDDEEADEEVTKLMEAAEVPGAALASLFEEEVVPLRPPPTQEILSLDLGQRGHVNELSYCRVVTFVAVEAF